MNIFRLAWEILLIYFLYKLIFGFIIPVYQSTKKIRKQFGEMESKMQQQNNNTQSAPTVAPPVAKEEEYIEFEEIK